MSATLTFEPAIKRPDLVSSSITKLLNHWTVPVPVEKILVAEINPLFAGGNDFCSHYGISVSEGANCVIVEGVRGDEKIIVACIAPVNCKMDFNGVVRKTLHARRVSLAPLDMVLSATGMEYGSVTPVGLPTDWKILIDSRLMDLPRVVVGAGLVKAKLSLSGKMLAQLPNATPIEGLGVPK